jgi:ribosomal protein S18 acetylase RimI-like enzyme
MKSMYAKYVEEREPNTFLIETPEGWIKYLASDVFYIQDIYVLPEFRRNGIATTLGEMAISVAREKGYKEVYISVVPKANGTTASLKAILKANFNLHSASSDLIIFVKEI